MAKSPAPIYPVEDIDLFYKITLLCAENLAKTGQFVSSTEAANAAFTILKQKGALAEYGPTSIKHFLRQFSQAQINTLSKLNAPIPLGLTGGKSVSKTGEFENNPILSAKLLDAVVANPSRPIIAVEFDIPMEVISMAVFNAI